MPWGNVVGIGYVDKYNADQIAREVVSGWMDSPGHRQNILDNTYSNMGVGVGFNGQEYYITQNFW